MHNSHGSLITSIQRHPGRCLYDRSQNENRQLRIASLQRESKTHSGTDKASHGIEAHHIVSLYYFLRLSFNARDVKSSNFHDLQNVQRKDLRNVSCNHVGARRKTELYIPHI